jgi:5-methyltetrahydrofolate--homocysteine methyltransferase
MKKTLLEALAERVLVSDGAMGTQLMAAGLEHGGCGELWNVIHPERVLAIQRRYVEAGADCLITNTFGGNGIALARRGHRDALAALNRAAVRIAREAFGGREGFVLGDVGPIGGLMEPYGELRAEDVRDGIRAQVRALVEEGVDAVIVETQTALEETEIGVLAAREMGAPCVIASMAYDLSPDGDACATMMGVDPEMAARHLLGLGVDVVALNCGTGVDMAVAARVVEAYRAAGVRFTMAQPNAGLPELEEGRVVYRQDPDAYVRPIRSLLDAGVNLVGGCCGTTPDHVRAIRREVDAWAGRQEREVGGSA